MAKSKLVEANGSEIVEDAKKRLADEQAAREEASKAAVEKHDLL